MRKLALAALVFLVVIPRPVSARYDPRERQNNKFGIHIIDQNDIPDAAALVNSSGGDWGYITVVITDKDKNTPKWQGTFDQFRRLHIIPLVRIATHLDGPAWVRPKIEDIDGWIAFLSSLNWPVENRYVILYNEPNHAKEWGGTVNPEEYAGIATEFASRLTSSSEDFFVLPAGLDASAGNTYETMDEAVFLRRIVQAKPDFLKSFGGWTSHSYPNPGFSAAVENRGRGSLTTYQWEANILKNLGLAGKLPVFITETGWIHSDGLEYEPQFLSPETVAENLKSTAKTIWSDNDIVAITPFILNYQESPFDHFSWRKIGQHEFYPQYFAYQAIEKLKGFPRQRESYQMTTALLPDILISGSRYTLQGTLKNTGQGIVSAQDGYDITISEATGSFESFVDPLPVIEPRQEGVLSVHLQTPKRIGSSVLTVALRHKNDTMKLEEKTVTLASPPALTVKAQLGWKRGGNATVASILVYDMKNTLLHKFSSVTIADGSAHVEGLTNIIPNSYYRVVMLVPYYLPRQKIVKLTATETSVSMNRFLPLDFNADGHFSLSDFRALVRLRPDFLFSLFFGF